MMRQSLILALLLALCASCKQKPDGQSASPAREESRQAKAMLQGVWVDTETEEVSFRAKGDSIFFPDSTSQPAEFHIAGDSLFIGSSAYHIEKQAAHTFWFKNQNGDIVKLSKSDDPNDVLDFDTQPEPKVLNTNRVVKTDSVVMLGGQRYHWYIAINPTRYKVTKTTYTDDGVEVENIYYDNIIHISLFRGAERLFSRDFRKEMYKAEVPKDFLSKAILGNMQYHHADAQGFHFHATLCIPDGASCYLVETLVGLDGKVEMKLLEY